MDSNQLTMLSKTRLQKGNWCRLSIFCWKFNSGCVSSQKEETKPIQTTCNLLRNLLWLHCIGRKQIHGSDAITNRSDSSWNALLLLHFIPVLLDISRQKERYNTPTHLTPRLGNHMMNQHRFHRPVPSQRICPKLYRHIHWMDKTIPCTGSYGCTGG